jgi:hypothetical protein
VHFCEFVDSPICHPVNLLRILTLAASTALASFLAAESGADFRDAAGHGRDIREAIKIAQPGEWTFALDKDRSPQPVEKLADAYIAAPTGSAFTRRRNVA